MSWKQKMKNRVKMMKKTVYQPVRRRRKNNSTFSFRYDNLICLSIATHPENILFTLTLLSLNTILIASTMHLVLTYTNKLVLNHLLIDWFSSSLGKIFIVGGD